MPGSPATAQLGASLSVHNQARLRGEPVSDGRPVAEMELAYDLPDGAYLGGSASVVTTRNSGVEPLAFTEYAGVARPLHPGFTLDLGMTHGGYTEYWNLGPGASYTEAYAGLVGDHLSGHAFFSPGYFHKNEPTVYVELDTNADLRPHWVVFAHAGMLNRLRSHPYREDGTAFDWRIGVRRRFGPADIDVAWTGGGVTGGEGEAYANGRSAFIAGITAGF